MNPKSNAMLKKLEEYKSHIKELIETGDLELAKLKLADYEKVSSSDKDIFSIKAIILMMENKLEECWFILWQGLQVDPGNVDLLFNLGYLWELKEQYIEAANIYNSALEISDEEELQAELKIKLNDISEKTKSKNTSNNSKILLGTMEIANQMNTISKGLNSLGVTSKTLSYYPSYLNYSSDFVVDINKGTTPEDLKNKLNSLTEGLLNNFNIFHFHFGTSLAMDNSDLRILKESGKKIYMHHWGSDVRQFSVMSKFNPYLKVKTNDEIGMRKKIAMMAESIQDAIVADFELYLNIKEFYNNIHFIPTSIDLAKYSPSFTQENEKLLIVHAPTSPEIKGTDYILATIEKLQLFYKFDFKLIVGMSHEEARSWYQKADLIVDQLLVGSYGLLAVESMAMGKSVICWITELMREKYPTGLPIISANPDTIMNVLESILKNPDQLLEIGKAGRVYAEKNHDMYKNTQQLLKIYDIN